MEEDDNSLLCESLGDVLRTYIDPEIRKRKCYEENQLQDNLFSCIKKIKLEEKPTDHEINLKKAVVYIGPKLPLPICLQLKVFDNDQSDSTKTKKLSNTSSSKATNKKLNKKKHIVLKVYTCSKCNLKHTNSALHEDHVATCVSTPTPTCYVSSSQVCSYKDRSGLFSCEFCKFKFKHEINLFSHQNKHVKTKGFTCCVCGVELGSIKKLQIHYHDFHQNCSKMFCCNICEYSIARARDLKNHMITHNSDKYLYCYKCKRNYDTVNDFSQHACKSLKSICLKRKKPTEVHKNGGKQSTKIHHSVQFSNLKTKFESEVIKTNGIYYCNGCSYRFSNYDYLVKHKKEHLKIQPYKCNVCKYQSFSVVDMGTHVRCHLSQEVKIINLKCSVCDMNFTKWQFLRRHAVSHIYDELYCSICRVNFEDSEALIQHMSSTHKQPIKGKMYSCSKCSFTHPVAGSLRKHMKLHEESKANPVSKDDVQVVDPNLRINTSLENVKVENDKSVNNKTTSLSSAFKCISCRIRFDNAIDFEEHNKGHLSKSTLISEHQRKKDSSKLLFKCNKCKCPCSDVNSLVDHVKLNHLNQEKPFACSVCDHKMESLTTYLLHSKSHHEIPTYLCQYCKYHTRTKKSFLQHYIKHNLKCCPMCIYSTTSLQAFKDHVNRQHKARSVPQPFVCTLCPYSSSKEKVLSLHALKFHPKEYPSLKLPVPNYLQKSLKNHDYKFNACSMCQFTNDRIHDFKRHLTKHFVNGQLSVKTLSKGVKKKSVAVKSAHLKNLNTCKINASTRGDSLFHYRCSQCNFRSKQRKTVSTHLLSIHNIKGGVRNNMILKMNAPLFSNIKSNDLRPEKSIIKCQHCEVNKFSLRAQKQHRRLGHNTFWKRPFSCLKCSSRFKKEMYLDNHNCKQSTPLMRKICNKYKTVSEQKLKNHSQICVKPSTTTKKVSKTSHHNQDIKTQMLKTIEDEECLSSGDESFSCGECNFVTLDVTDLIKHMFIHSGVQED